MYRFNAVFFSFMMLVFASLPQICEGGLGQPKDVSFTASIDGSVQYYMEMLPSDFNAKQKYDLIIALHGHGSDRQQFATANRGEASAFREFASKHNMIAITPDYRAKTSWMGPKAEADLLQIIGDLKKKYNIGRVFVMGGSMGATSALTFAVLHPDMVDGVTALNGLANHLEYTNFQDAISESFGGTKDKIPLEYKKRSAEYWPELLTMPVAFTTGGKDKLVPPDSALRLAEVLKKLNRKVFVIHRQETGHETSFADSMAALEYMYDPAKPVSVSSSAPVSAPNQSNAAAGNPESGDWASAVPQAEAPGKVELGLKFSVQKDGKVKALRFYQANGESGAHTLRLWNADGTLTATVNAPEKQGAGWISAVLPEPLAVKAGATFIVSYTCNAKYPATADVFKAPLTRGGITGITGLYSMTDLGQKAPEKTFKNMNYFLDVDFEQQ